MTDPQPNHPLPSSADNSTPLLSRIEPTGRDRIPRAYLSPHRLLLTIVISIFMAEVIAMVVVSFFKTWPYQVIVLIDASLMLIMIVPVLYFFSFQPLLSHIRRSEQAEQVLQKRNRALDVLNECNQLLLHARQETEFLQQMCEIIVQTGQYRMAWIGFARQDADQSIDVAAQFGFESGYLEQANISWGDNDLGQGPTGTAIRQGIVQVNQNFLTNPKTGPWRESALSRGYQASIALPLQSESSTIGALTIYSALSDAFDDDEVQLLDELADNLAFGIVTLRVRAQRQQVEERNRRLSRIVEQTEDTVVVTDPSGIIEYVNPAFERLTGYAKEEALGKTPRVLKSGLHNRKYYKTLWDTILRGEVFQKEIANGKKNGEIFYEIKTITPLRDTDGKITHFVATGKDITEHKRDEEKLQQAYGELEIRVQERTEELRVAIDNLRIANSKLEEEIVERKQAEAQLHYQAALLARVNDAIIASDAQFRITAWNAAAESLYGWKAEEVIGHNGLDIVHTEWLEQDPEVMRRTITEKGGWRGEATQARKDGTRFPVEVSAIVLYNDKRQVTGYISVNRDITARKQADEVLHRFELLSGHSRDIILFMRFQDGRILEVNRAARQAYGYSYEEFLELSIQDLRADDTDDLTPDQMTQANTQGILFETTHCRKDGSLFPVEVSSQGATISGTRMLVSIVRDISERKRAEQALRESEEKYRLISDNANDWIYWIKPDQSFQYMSPSCERVTGFSPTDFMKYPELFQQIIHPDDRERVVTHLEDVHEKAETHNLDYRILTKSNEVRWISHSCDPVYGPDGGYIGRNGTNRDITERKQAEAALRQSEENFSKAFKSSPAALLITRLADGCFLEVNESYSAIVGYERNELLGHRTIDFNIYIKSTDRQEIVERLKTSGSIRGFETSIRHRSGKIRHVVAAQELITFNEDPCILTNLLDITERKLTEEALRSAHDELEARVQERTQELVKEIAEREEIERQMRIRTTAMEAAANGIVITDRQGLIQWTNPALAQISGYSTEELLDQNMKIFNSGEQDAAYYRELWKVILAGEVWRGEITNRRKDGSCYTEEQIITPVRGDDSQITHFISIKQDITARKEAQRDLQQRNEKEKTLTDTIHTMQLDIARDLHDTIGQNISFLRMKLDYLAEKEIRKKAEIQAELRNMARAANESYDLIRGTLAMLQSEHSTDLFRLFTRYAEQIEERASFKVVVSSQGEPRFMSAKRMRQLFYIFREILNNIEKHANASQVSMMITWNPDALTLAVLDNGQGFDPGSVPYGSHYGLRFMKERAEILNGSLLVRSESGTGTKIVLQVPYE